MVDLPAGFRVVTPNQQAPVVPPGFRVVQPSTSSNPPVQYDAQGRPLLRVDPGNEDMGPSLPPSAGDWRRGILAPIEKNTETGAFRPAVPQIALDAWNAVTLPGDVAAGNVPDLMPGTSFGNMSDETAQRAFDLSGMSTIGAPVGSAGAFSTNTGQRLPAGVTRALDRGGISPSEVGPRVQAMGPGAVAADISPSMQTLAMGAAARPSAGQSQFFEMLSERASGARPRIQEQINAILGPSVSRGQTSARIAELKSATSPIYREAFSGADPVNVSSIAQALDDMIPNYAGTAQNRLRTIRGWLNEGGGLTENPQLLFSVRNELDDILDNPDLGRVRETIQNVRNMVDGELAQRVPGIKDADSQWQELSRQASEFDVGTQLFRSGPTTEDPRDLATRLLTDIEPQGTQLGPSGGAFALSQGARNEIDRLIGTGSANRTALANAIRGDGTWNREKLAQVFGEERADQIIRVFENEATMQNTETRAMGQSVTGLRTAADEDLNPRIQAAPIFQGPTGIDIGNLLRRGASKLTGGISDRVAENRNKAIIEALMETGGWYENRTSPATLSLVRALLLSGDPSREEGLANGPLSEALLGQTGR